MTTVTAPCREEEAYAAGRLAGFEDGLDAPDVHRRFLVRRSSLRVWQVLALTAIATLVGGIAGAAGALR